MMRYMRWMGRRAMGGLDVTGLTAQKGRHSMLQGSCRVSESSFVQKGIVRRRRDREVVFGGRVWCSGLRGTSADDTSDEEIEVSLPEVCPGCGVRLQLDDPDEPGYCRVPDKIMRMLEYGVDPESVEQVPEEDDFEDDDVMMMMEDIGSDDDMLDGEGFVRVRLDEGDDDADDFNAMIQSLNMMEQMDGGASTKRKEKKPMAKPVMFEEEEDDLFSTLVCERCYSLKHYGKVKSSEAELVLPEFDVAKAIGDAMALRQFRRTIILIVVDLVDFDGSLPRSTIQSMMLLLGGMSGSSFKKESNFSVVVAANKSDLLPKEATASRLEQWVRRRISQGGLPRPSSVHIVSSYTRFGVNELVIDLQKSLRNATGGGDVWVIGAQNAGKSSLINAMRKTVKSRSEKEVTAAPVPGTTIGIVNVSGGIVPPGCDMLDTPGVKHDYQLTTRMHLDEVRMLLPRRRLKPRTYRLGAGNTICLGGLGRIDVVTIPGSTIYITVWASDEVRTHLGKTENAEHLLRNHTGLDLVPPIAVNSDDSDERVLHVPELEETDVVVQGNTWKANSVDVCIAGLGWASVGVNGTVELKVWAPKGVAITTREAIVPDMAKEFCKPGYDSLLQKDKKGKKQKKTKQR